MKINKLDKTLTEQAYEILLDKICLGELESGDRLNQDLLAKELDISRQPINSAISILKSNGFVKETGRRGVVVAPITAKQFNSIYEFRGAIELFAVQLATERKPKSAEQQAKKVLKNGWDAVNSGNRKQLLQSDFEFHLLIYNWTQNSSLIDAMQFNWNHIRRGMNLVLNESEYPLQSWNEHERMMHSILKGDIQGAVADIKAHIENAKNKTIELLGNS